MLKYDKTGNIVKKIVDFKKQIYDEVFLMKRGEIQAVHDDDLTDFLKSIEEYDRVIGGNAKCFFCDRTITLDNIQSMFPLQNQVEYCCNSEICYSQMIEGSYHNVNI